MQHYLRFITCSLFLTILAGSNGLFAQVDSLQNVEILNYTKRLTFKTINDSTQLTIIAGNVKLRQGTSLFYCDSCVINSNSNVFEAWGHVHINDADTTDIYSKHLRYLMKNKQAFLDGGVTLTDGKGTLTTPDLEYDMNTNLGIYKNGGKLINKKTVLTSGEGWYFSDLKDAYFKKNVVLKDTAYTIVTDSLLYNSATQTMRFISMTTITDSSGRIIKTKEGYYDQQSGKAEFGQRPIMVDGDIEAIGDRAKFDDSTGISQLEGNAIVVDKKNKTTIIAGTIFRNKKTEAILAIRKPLMIIVQDNDTIYLAADTLFSARLTDLQAAKRSMGLSTVSGDTTSTLDSSVIKEKNDSLTKQLITTDTLTTEVITNDTITIQNDEVAQIKDSMNKVDTATGSLVIQNPDSLKIPKDSVLIRTTKGLKLVALNEKDSTNRYFEAYAMSGYSMIRCRQFAIVCFIHSRILYFACTMTR